MDLEIYFAKEFAGLQVRSKKYGADPNITKSELIKWLYDNDFEKMFSVYKKSKFNRKLKPSIDRINDYEGYYFKNMQLITWEQNHHKGVTGEKHNKATQISNKSLRDKKVYQYDKDYNLIATYESCVVAGNVTGIHRLQIMKACNLVYNKTNGYYFSYYPITKETHKKNIHKASIGIEQYDLNENFIRSFVSFNEAARSIGKIQSTISWAAKDFKNRQAHGFKWKTKK